jgi:hypothetical protein
MLQTLQPCTSGWSPAEVVQAIGVAVNLCLLTFLARRRVAADRTDSERWSTCPLVNGERREGSHRHTPGREKKRLP